MTYDAIARDVRIMQGDVIAQLKLLKKESVHCVITSPPYWRLRDYGVEGQLGLEATPKEYIRNMVRVFRQVRRVLRKDGTCWVNMGDSHIHQTVQTKSYRRDGADALPKGLPKGFKVKDKALMPHRMAIALQDDGWYVRQDIVWHKQQPQPETVSDRPTTSHEYFFLLTRSERYWYDAEAIAEPCSEKTQLRSAAASALRDPAIRDQGGVNAKIRMTTPGAWATNSDARTAVEHSRSRIRGPKQNESFSSAMSGAVQTRNKRSVWPVFTDRMDLKMCTACKHVYTGAEFDALPMRKEVSEYDQTICSTCGSGDKWLSHFAAFAAEWIEPAVLAGCPAQVCPTCGTPTGTDAEGRMVLACAHKPDLGVYYTPKTVAGIVADCFAGTGTTGGVAVAHGRRAILTELNPDYIHLMPHRMEQVVRRLLDKPKPEPVPNKKNQVALELI